MLKGYNQVDYDELTWWRVLFDREVCVNGILNVLCMFQTTFFTSYLSLYVKEQFNVNSGMLGMLYSLTALSYVVCCVLAPMFLGSVPPRIQLSSSIWSLMITFILFGPSPTLGLPNKYWIMCISSIFSGYGFCMPSILFTRVVKDRLTLKYKIVEGSNDALEKRLNDLNSLAFLVAQTFGTLIAPLIGALTYEWKGHRLTCDIFAVSYLVISILMTVFYTGFKPYED